MKFIIDFYLIIVIVLIILTFLGSRIAMTEFKKENPSVAFRQISATERFAALIRYLVIVCCPFVNAILLIYIACRWEDYLESCYDKLEDLVEYF